MKKLPIFAAMGLALIPLIPISTAQAANGAEPTVIAKVEVTGSARYQLAPHEFDNFKGRYAFDDGTSIRVWQQQNRFYAQIADQSAQQMFAAAPGVFESITGAKLHFADDGSTVSVKQFGTMRVASGSLRMAKN